MTGIAVEIFMKEIMGIIMENIMMIMVTIADRDVASRDGRPGGPG